MRFSNTVGSNMLKLAHDERFHAWDVQPWLEFSKFDSQEFCFKLWTHDEPHFGCVQLFMDPPCVCNVPYCYYLAKSSKSDLGCNFLSMVDPHGIVMASSTMAWTSDHMDGFSLLLPFLFFIFLLSFLAS